MFPKFLFVIQDFPPSVRGRCKCRAREIDKTISLLVLYLS